MMDISSLDCFSTGGSDRRRKETDEGRKESCGRFVLSDRLRARVQSRAAEEQSSGQKPPANDR